MLKITKSFELMPVKQIVVALYGSPGCGKSTLGFSCDTPLMLDFDKGAYRAKGRKDTVVIDNWSDVTAIDSADLEKYHTIIVDTAGRCLDALSADIIARNPKMGRGGALTLQGYGQLKSDFAAWLKNLRSFGKDVVLIAHSSEERDGDDLIERLDMQGSSKNEVYKSADAMGRMFIRGNDRMLNFSPTGTQFGKNPGNLEIIKIPDTDTDPECLKKIIGQIKTSLNAATEEQVIEQARLNELRVRINALETSVQFTEMTKTMSGSQPKDKALLMAAAKEKGFTWNKEFKAFEERQEEVAA